MVWFIFLNRLFIMMMYDVFVSVFVIMCFVVFGWNVLRRYWVMIIRSMVFIIIVWVVNWVYYYIVNGWMNIVLVCCISFI